MDTLKNPARLNLPLDTHMSSTGQSVVPVQSSGPISEKNILHIHVEENLEKIIRLLSDRNLRLLTIIGNQKPKTLAELSRMSGRPKASLTRTLSRLAKIGVIVLSKSKGRAKTPTLVCHQLNLNINLFSPK